MPRISVVMTTYNTEPFVKQAVESILNQTFNDFELIIVNDGSTDKTVDQITAIKDSRIRLFENTHRGRAASLNFAIQKVTGEYVAFMDSDDISFPERLAEQTTFLDSCKDIDVVSAWFYRITENGRIKRLIRLPQYHKEIERYMFKYCTILFSCTMIRSNKLSLIGDFNENLSVAIDYEFFVRALPYLKMQNIQKPLLYYRQREVSITEVFKEKSHAIVYQILTHSLATTTLKEKNKKKYFLYSSTTEYYYGDIKKARYYSIQSLKNGDYRAMSIFFRSLFGHRFIYSLRIIIKALKQLIISILLRYGREIDYSK